MKRIVSVRGVFLVVVLLVAALSAGTALADRQSAASPQASLSNAAGASIVTQSTCLNPIGLDEPATLTIWGSGWASEELVLISIIKSSTEMGILFSGAVNPAGAFEVSFDILPKAQYSRKEKRVQAPAAGIYTLEAIGTSGRLATAPIIISEAKCSGV
jgi:hypothetical protein